MKRVLGSEEKRAIVTGSTKGIGKAIGMKLLENGYFVIFNYANDDKIARELKAELKNYTGQFVIIKQKLQSEYDVSKFVEKCKQYVSQIDVLVLNAGCTDRTEWGKIKWSQWEHVMNVNLNAPAELIRKMDSSLSSGGNIIFIGAIMGVYTHSISIAYSVSKAGINGLTKSLVKEYCERNIRVNAVLPGFVETPWQKNKPTDQRKRINEKISLHRFATPEEIAEVVYDN